MVAPADCAIRAASRVCSADSTAHGPARKVNVSGPIGTRRPAGADPHRGPVGVVLAADELVGVGDAVHVGDALERAQVEVVERLEVSDEADDGAHDALADERLPADPLDLLDDVRDVLVGGIR